MNKSDLAMLILIASVAIMVALPFLKVDNKNVKVPTIELISSDVTEPDSEIFNKDAINPTVKTVIGDK
jgi:hypothetical protein